jgi:hypothetical protein
VTGLLLTGAVVLVVGAEERGEAEGARVGEVVRTVGAALVGHRVGFCVCGCGIRIEQSSPVNPSLHAQMREV